MARLLGRLLETDERWNRYWWVDDALPMSARHPVLLKNPSGYELQVQGLMIWGQKGTSKDWVEPSLMALSEVVEVFKYQIHYGDAVQGLGKVPYGHQSKKTARLLPEQWQFAFSGNRQVPASPNRKRKIHFTASGKALAFIRPMEMRGDCH